MRHIHTAPQPKVTAELEVEFAQKIEAGNSAKARLGQ